MKKAGRVKNTDRDNLSFEIKAEKALKEAVAEAIAEHKRRGYPIAVWRDGNAVWVPAEEIEGPTTQRSASAGQVRDSGDTGYNRNGRKP